MQFQFWQIIVLAVVQGITEFLPVSSSGHLVIIGALMAPGGDAKELDIADVSIVLHLGTLLSVLVFYWRRLLRLLGDDRRTIGLVFVASLPAAIIGLPIKLLFDDDSMVNIIMSSPLAAGLLLPVTGMILLYASSCKHGTQEYQTMSYGNAFLIGLAQAVAILPGISRSGSTISAGIRLGLNSQAAATFSFIMSIVVVGGVGLAESIKLMKHPINSPASHLFAGAIISFIVGLGALWVLVRLLERGRFQFFAYWCILAGFGIVIWRIREGDFDGLLGISDLPNTGSSAP